MESIHPKLVSIIVPVYNAENYLAKCVDSILHQTYLNLEIILVDDGARDNSPAMCDQYAQTDHRVRVIHKENGGLMTAWMAGVDHSVGDYLCFIDSDDWVDLCMIEELMKQASGEVGEIICCNFVIERTNGTQKQQHELPPGVYQGDRLQKEVKEKLLGNEHRTVSMSRCMKLFSRELIVRNMKYCNPKIRMGEDVNIVLPALYDSSRVVILPEAHYYHYYYNDASMVHKYDPRMADGIRELIRTIEVIFRDKSEDCRWEEQWEKEAVYLLMLAVKNELRGGRKGYSARTAELCRQENVTQRLRKYEIRPEDKVNLLLTWVMNRPGRMRCFLGKAIFRMYDLCGSVF